MIVHKTTINNRSFRTYYHRTHTLTTRFHKAYDSICSLSLKLSGDFNIA